MAVVVESYTSNSQVDTSSITLTKPSGVSSGDLLLILVGNDCPTTADQWDDSSNKPSGFTLINEIGDATSDAHIAAFWRIADGTEGASIAAPAVGTYDYWGFYMHITGADTTTPINVFGSGNLSSSIPITVSSITTTVDACLGIVLMGGDGGDLLPYTVSTNSWVKGAEKQAGTLGSNASGCWGYKTIASAGASGSAYIDAPKSDGSAGYIFAIAPSSTPSTDGYIKVWSGTAWELKPVKVWSGTAWEIKPVKHWGGGIWNIT